MDLKTPLGILRWLLVLSMLVCGMTLCVAQTKSAQPTNPVRQAQKVRPPAPNSIWLKDPNSVMPMRQMTNAQRLAAAERNKARRAKAEAQRRNGASSLQGVRQ